MSNKELKIAFMGTPDFALPVLEALCENYTVSCVITKIDKPKGRGYEPAPSPVKSFAVSRGIPVLQPVTLKTEEFQNELKSFGADLFVTCAYGKILPQEVLDIPRLGTINVHASLLPKYRGAAPLWHMVINGEKEVGVTTMYTDAGMDTGDILEMTKMPLGENETMGEVHDKLSAAGGEIIVRTINKLLDGTLTRTKQNDEEATYAPPIKKEQAEINWNKTAKEIHNLIRGMNPFPAAYSYLGGDVIKIFGSHVINENSKALPGTVTGITEEGGIKVSTTEGTLVIDEVQTAGKKRMQTKAYLNGHPLGEGARFGS